MLRRRSSYPAQSRGPTPASASGRRRATSETQKFAAILADEDGIEDYFDEGGHARVLRNEVEIPALFWRTDQHVPELSAQDDRATDRLAKLSGGVAVIRVVGATEVPKNFLTMVGVFAEFERAIDPRAGQVWAGARQVARQDVGTAAYRGQQRGGDPHRFARRQAGIIKLAAAAHGVGVGAVQRIKASLNA
jgi:hypothetical protein